MQLLIGTSGDWKGRGQSYLGRYKYMVYRRGVYSGSHDDDDVRPWKGSAYRHDSLYSTVVSRVNFRK